MPAQEIIPSGIAKTVDITALAALTAQIETLNDTMLYMITALLDKLPRVDVNDRQLVNLSETTLPTVSTVSTVTGVTTVSTVTACTTVGTVTNMTNLNNLSGGNAQPIPFQISNMGALHLYQQIQVTA